MAKVGEGDPRWIVSDRKDGANVNAWHWEERDLSRHTHDQLKKRFKGLVLACNTNGVKEIRIDEVSEISGDVTVAQRKGKMMCYFELKMTLKWSGECEEEEQNEDESDEKGKIKGKMEIFEVDHDTFRDEYDISVSCTENDARASKVENLVRSRGREAVRNEIVKYFNELFEDYHIGQILKANTKMPPPPPLPTSPSSCACPGIPTTSCSTTTNTTTSNNYEGTKQNECNTQQDNQDKTNTTSHAKSEEGTSLSLRMK